MKLRLFFCSYAPLFLICGVRFESLPLALVCGVLAVASTLTGVLVVWAARRMTPSHYRITTVDDRGPEVAGYLATYILPFVTVAQPTWRDIMAYAIFLTVSAVVYVRSEMIQINPTLYLFGWKVRAVSTSSGMTGYLITRRDVTVQAEIDAVRFQDTLLIDHRWARGG